MKSTRILLLLLILLTACAGGDTPQPDRDAATATPFPTAPAAARPTYVVQRGTVQEDLTFTGRWLPRDQLALAFEIAGTVRRVNVRRGDAVVAGQLLADYQIDDLEDQLESALLSLQTAQANPNSGESGTVQSIQDAEIALANARLSLQDTRMNAPWTGVESARIGIQAAERELENARRDYNDALSRPESDAGTVNAARERVLAAEDALRRAELSYYSSAQSFNSHNTQVKQAENRIRELELALERARDGVDDPGKLESLRSAELHVQQIEERIAQASLFAPIDGVILEINIRPGDNVAAFQAVITIALPEPKEAIANLPFGDVQRLSIGQVGVCEVINQPETAVQCVIRQLPISNRDADQTTRVAASLDNVPDGQIVEIRMPLDVRENVLWLPPAAIRTFQNRTFVVLQTADGPRSVDVEIGLRTADRVELISGVQAGDVVIGP